MWKSLLTKKFIEKFIIILFLLTYGQISASAQGTQTDFSSIPKSGTILIYSHMDDDLIWMLPFWSKSEKFIGGAMPASPSYRTIISQQQTFMNNNGYGIDYESNWYTPWEDVTDIEYTEYYWGDNPSYQYILNDHIETRLYNNPAELSRFEINKTKAKLEQYFADPSMSRVMSHNNWGEYGHQHHRGLNKAVRELAVKYRRDMWMLGCDNGGFVDVTVPNGITWAYGSFDKPDLYTGIRDIYNNNGRWTWYTDRVPSGDHKFIKIVDGGNDKSYTLKGDQITYPGPDQLEAGAYIFDGDDDYMTLKGNNNSSFTISMRIRPDLIREMDIAAMAEYPLSSKNDRNLYLTGNGHITARINDGSSKVTTSSVTINAGTWSHIAITGNRSSLKLYINGILDKTISTGTAINNFTTPEFVLGQALETSSYFKGQISSVKFYDHPLTDSEIATLSGMVYYITSSAGTGGTINPSGTASIEVGSSKTYSIIPGTGYKVADVLVDNVSQDAVTSYTFTNVTTNHSISASFTTTATYTITASAGTGGSISPSGTVTANEGSNQTFSISPALGYKVADVKVDYVSVGAVSSYTLTNIVANHIITVSFELTPTFTISVTAGTGGTITPGTVTMNEGTNQAFSITPGAGYRISNVVADGTSVGAVSSYAFSNITANHTLSASFAVLTYNITSSAGSGGSIDLNGTHTVNYGSSLTYNFTSNTGYHVSNVLVDNVSVGSPSSYTFNNITAGHTIAVSFSINTNTITASAGTGGSISPSGDVSVNWGSNQSFSISTGTGYYISDVKINGISAGAINSYTFSNVMSAHSISVTFAQIIFTITGSAGPGGSISPSGNSSVAYGSSRIFILTPDFGFQVSDLIVDNVPVGTGATYAFSNVTSNHTISASFTTATYALSSTAGTGGSISPSGTVSVLHGSNQTFSITPANGYRINDVRIDNVSAGQVSSYAFSNITSSHTISVTFAIITYTVTATAENGGSISPSGETIVNYGTNRTFTVTPNTGYYIKDVIVDNVPAGAVSTFTFNNVTASHTISASFSLYTYSVTCSAGTGGSVSPSGVSSVNYGSNPIYTITPDEGYLISDVKVDNNSLGALSSYTFNNITAPHTLSAAFEPIKFTISSNHQPGGSINITGNITINYGSNQVCTIIPDTGFQIEDVLVDNRSVGAVSTYTFENIKGNHTISAVFSIIRYTINVNNNPGGIVNPVGKTMVNYGSDLTIAITPDYGYRIAEVKADGNTAGTVSSYSMANITANHDISVTFMLIKTYTINAATGAGGTITPSEPVTLFEGTDQAYEITPEPGYRILDVFVDNKSQGPVNDFSFTNIGSDHIIKAEFTTSIDVKAYPNPFMNEFSLFIASPGDSKFDMSIADLNGKIVYTQKKLDGNTVIPLDLQVPKGLYIMRLYLKNNKIATIRLIKA